MKVTKFTPQEGLKISDRKEKMFYEAYDVVTFDGKEFDNPISLRFYGSKAKNYACLWIHTKQQTINGSGNAGGYGYHRASEAAAFAFRTAGFTFDEGIGGHGDGAVRDALEAICKHLGYKKFYIQHAHG